MAKPQSPPAKHARKPPGYDELPHAQVQITDALYHRDETSIAVVLGGVAIAKLPVTKVAFERSYGDGLSYVTLTLIAGDSRIQTRPDYAERPGGLTPTCGKP